MKLRSVKIENFKSIKSLELKISDNLYCLIGKNEIGKSNILQAISWLSNSQRQVEDANLKKINQILKNAKISAIFEINDIKRNELQKIIDLFKTTNNQTSVEERQKENERLKAENIDSIQAQCRIAVEGSNLYSLILKDGSILSTRNLSDGSKKESFLNRINAFYPQIQIFEQEEFLIRPINAKQITETTINNSPFIKLFKLGGINDLQILVNSSVQEIIEIKETVSAKINELLRRYYKQDSSLNVRIESHDGYFSLHFKDDYYRLNSLEDRSTGFQYFFSFLINKIYSNEFESKNSIYLFDEPALSLHPTGQKDFLKLLEDLSKENQVLYTTHSPFSINRMKPNQVWVVEKSTDKGTFVNYKPFQKNWHPLRSSLGIDISDSFFYGDKSLLVEGPEDRIFIGALLNHFSNKGLIKLKSDLISIIDAGSISNMPAMVQILIDEQRPLFVLMDADDTAIYNRLKKKEDEIKNKQSLTVLKISEINKDAVSIEDLLPYELYINSVKNYLNFLIEEKVIILSNPERLPEFENISEEKRYQQIAHEICQKYQNPDKTLLDKRVPISKVGISHEFEKLLLNPNYSLNDDAVKNCLMLVELIISKLALNV